MILGSPSGNLLITVVLLSGAAAFAEDQPRERPRPVSPWFVYEGEDSIERLKPNADLISSISVCGGCPRTDRRRAQAGCDRVLALRRGDCRAMGGGSPVGRGPALKNPRGIRHPNLRLSRSGPQLSAAFRDSIQPPATCLTRLPTFVSSHRRTSATGLVNRQAALRLPSHQSPPLRVLLALLSPRHRHPPGVVKNTFTLPPDTRRLGCNAQVSAPDRRADTRLRSAVKGGRTKFLLTTSRL